LKHSYDIIYYKTTFIGLPFPFKTGCHQYLKNDSSDWCLAQCFKNKYKNTHNCLNGYFDFIIIYNSSDIQYKSCSEYEFNERSVSECISICPQDCIHRNYEFESIETFTRLSSNTTVINLFTKISDEITYRYTPKMSYNEFFGSFGGLVSMWLGFSIITLYDFICKYCNEVIEFSKNKSQNKNNRNKRSGPKI